MALKPMYPPQNNSPHAEITTGINAVATQITVDNGAILPAAPCILTLGAGEDAELVYMSSKNGNILIVTRGYYGTTAKAWDSNTWVRREITSQDIEAIQQNIEELDTGKANTSGYYAGLRAGQSDNIVSPDNQEIYAEYIFRTAGGSASINSGDAQLVFIRGNCKNPTRVNEAISVSSSSPELYTSIDAATWRTSDLGDESGTYSFVYSSEAESWQRNGSDILLATYGVICSGTTNDGDTITVYYVKLVLGTILVATPSAFKSVGLNQFDKETMILTDFTINASGAVTPLTGSYVAFIHSVGGLDNGYTVHSSGGGIVRVGWNEAMPASGTTGIDLAGATLNATTSYIEFDDDGYICVATTDINGLCIHPRWSGYEDATYEAYNQTVIPIPTVDASNNPLPTATYGIPKIGGVYDGINFDTKTYVKRIGWYSYSAVNLATVQALGVDYDYDLTNIFYVLQTPQTIPLADVVAGEYTVADFGTEEFTDTVVPLYAENLYGQNLRDKLRTDVLTLSPQSLTPEQQAIVREKIGAGSGGEFLAAALAPANWYAQTPDANGEYWYACDVAISSFDYETQDIRVCAGDDTAFQWLVLNAFYVLNITASGFSVQARKIPSVTINILYEIMARGES